MRREARGARFDKPNKRLATTQCAQIRRSKLGKLFLATALPLTGKSGLRGSKKCGRSAIPAAARSPLAQSSRRFQPPASCENSHARGSGPGDDARPPKARRQTTAQKSAGKPPSAPSESRIQSSSPPLRDVATPVDLLRASAARIASREISLWALTVKRGTGLNA